MIRSLHSVGRGGGWTPLSIASLAAWYRADAGVTADGGGNVTAWADQSGNGYALSSAGSPPKYQATGWNGSLPSVRFTPTQYLLNASLGAVANGPSATFSVLATVHPNSTANYRALAVVDDTGGGHYVQTFLDVSHHAACNDDNGNFPIGSAAADGANRRLCYLVGAGKVDAYVDGALDLSAATLGNAAYGTLNRFLLGTNILGAAGWDGDMEEVVVCSSKLAAGDVASYQAWSVARWGA